MTPLKLISQTIVLYCLGISAIFLIFSQPEDTSATWFSTLFLSKAAGIVTALIFFRLHRRWMKPAHTVPRIRRHSVNPRGHRRQESRET